MAKGSLDTFPIESTKGFLDNPEVDILLDLLVEES